MSGDAWTLGAQVIGAVSPIVAAALAWASRDSRQVRGRLAQDVGVLEKLPGESPARQRMLELVEIEVDALVDQHHGQRSVPGMIAGALGILAFGGLTLAWLVHGGTLATVGGVVASLVTSFFVYGFFESTARVPRDAKGRRLERKDPADASEETS